MDPFLEHLTTRVDATAADLKTSLHSHVDSTVDSRLDTFKVELASLVRSAVVECIRTEGRYQHWRVETTYTPCGSDHQHNQSLNDDALMPNHSTSFIEGIPPPLLTELSAVTTSQCIATYVTFPSGHSVSIPLYNVQPNQHQSQHISEQSSLLPNLDTAEQDNTSAQSAQTNNNKQINPEPFQTDNRVSLLPIASTSAAASDGLPSTNSVSSPSNESSPVRTVQPPNDIHIIQEQLDDQSDNEDPDTNTHNVNLNKTESMDSDFEVVKEEIKEEDEDDDCDGCDRWIVKKEEVSDDDEVNNEGHEERLPFNEVNDEDGVTRGDDNDEVDDEPNVDNGQLLSNLSRDNQNTFNVNDFIDEGGASLEGQEQIANTANQSNDQTQSDDLLSPLISTGQGSNRIVLTEQATVSTQQKVTKRKQPTSKRSAKRSKQTIEYGDDDGEVDIANEDREDAKVKIVYLNCTESNCTAKLDSVVHLHDHLRTVHQILPLQCFATNCKARFDNRGQIGDHIKLWHSQSTQFDCAVCHAEYDSQHDTYNHWYQNHLNGQFECNLTGDCAQVTNTRVKMNTHQTKHHTYSKHLHCTHPGCTATFAFQAHLKLHERTHLDGNKFHCIWPHCSKQCKLRGNLVTHIRTQHFGLPKSMKEQKDGNIVDQRDPNEYVRLVVDE